MTTAESLLCSAKMPAAVFDRYLASPAAAKVATNPFLTTEQWVRAYTSKLPASTAKAMLFSQTLSEQHIEHVLSVEKRWAVLAELLKHPLARTEKHVEKFFERARNVKPTAKARELLLSCNPPEDLVEPLLASAKPLFCVTYLCRREADDDRIVAMLSTIDTWWGTTGGGWSSRARRNYELSYLINTKPHLVERLTQHPIPEALLTTLAGSRHLTSQEMQMAVYEQACKESHTTKHYVLLSLFNNPAVHLPVLKLGTKLAVGDMTTAACRRVVSFSAPISDYATESDPDAIAPSCKPAFRAACRLALASSLSDWWSISKSWSSS